jgi:chromosome segregation ATPase
MSLRPTPLSTLLLATLAVGLLATIFPSGSAGQEAADYRQVLERFTGRPVASLRQDLHQVQSKLQRLRTHIKLLASVEKAIAAQQITNAELEARINDEPVAQDLLAQLAEVQAKYKEAKQYWVESHPLVQDLRGQLESLQKVLQDYRTERRAEIVGDLRKELQLQFNQDVIVPLQEKVALLAEEEKDLKGAIEQSESKTASIKEAEDRSAQRITCLEDEVRQLRQAIESLKKSVQGRRR